MNKKIFKDLKFEYKYNSRLKHSYINITPDAKIIVKTSIKDEKKLFKLLSEKELWIRDKIAIIDLNPPLAVLIKKEVLLFGKLISIEHKDVSSLRKNISLLNKENKETILKCYDQFYKDISVEYLTKRVEKFSNIMNLQFSQLIFKKLKGRWGSCDSNKKITLNTNLIKIDKELIDYVIVHELSHLVYMNHSKLFHAFVQKYLINEKILRSKLKQINFIENLSEIV